MWLTIKKSAELILLNLECVSNSLESQQQATGLLIWHRNNDIYELSLCLLHINLWGQGMFQGQLHEGNVSVYVNQHFETHSTKREKLWQEGRTVINRWLSFRKHLKASFITGKPGGPGAPSFPGFPYKGKMQNTIKKIKVRILHSKSTATECCTHNCKLCKL